MKIRMAKTLFAAVVWCAAAPAATLNVNISPLFQNGLPGTVFLFRGTISNSTGGDLLASDMFFSFSGFDPVHVSLTQLLGSPDFALPNASSSGIIDLFTLALNPTAIPGTYQTDVVLQDVQGDISPVVTIGVTAVPEPASALLLLAGATLLASRRSKRAALALAIFLLPLALRAQHATLVTQIPGVYSEGNRLYLALPVGNLGPAKAENVRVSSIRLATATQLTPVTLPAPLGDIGPDAQAVLDASFSFLSDPAGRRFLLTVSGSYSVKGQTLGFSLKRVLVIRQPTGTFTAHSAIVSATVFRGGPFHPQPIPGAGFEHEQGNVPPIPIGPLRPMQPGSEFVVRNPQPNESRVITPLSTGDPLTVSRNSQYSSNAFDPPDPSGASAANLVLATANTFISVSTDDGLSFTMVNLTTIFPDIASPGKDADGNVTDSGMCCDQSVRYLPTIDRFIWLMQFWKTTAPGGGNINKLRIAVAKPADILSKGIAGDGVWTAWDMTSATFRLGEDDMDFPDMATGDSFAYFCINKVNVGGFVVRMPLSELRDGTTLHINYTDPNEYTKKMTRHGGSTMYWALLTSTSSLQVYSWPESLNEYSVRTVPVSSRSLNFNVTDPTGKPAFIGSVASSTVQGAARRYVLNPFTGGFLLNELWFAWGNGNTAINPYPSVRLTRIDADTFGLIQEIDIRNNEHAITFPDLASSQTVGVVGADIGFTFLWGGNKFYGNPGVGLFTLGSAPGQMVSPANTELVSIGTSDASPFDRSGDYLTVVPHAPNGGVFSAFNYVMVNDPTQAIGFRWDCRAIRFGRASAFTGGPPK